VGGIALLFPGQGAQAVGMGRDVARTFDAAARTFETASKVLGWDVARRCFEGPEAELNRTSVSQPCLLTVSVAFLRALEQVAPALAAAAEAAAGLSLGEYTALVAADALDFEEALRLVAERGRLMEEACRLRPGGMVSVLGLDGEAVEAICREVPGATPANFNCPGQVVVSGEAAALERVARLARERGARRVVPLKVEGAFHSPHMASARDGLRQVLAGVAFRAPSRRVVANVNARFADGPETIRRHLADQLTGPVRWQQSMERLLAEGFETFYEVGPGKVLTGLMRRIRREATCVALDNLQALEDAAGAKAGA